MAVSWLISGDAQLFISVVRAGSLSAHARLMGCSVDTLSQRLLCWQSLLPKPLFSIHQDLLLMTLEGQRLYNELSRFPS